MQRAQPKTITNPTEERILEAASNIFAEEGFAGARVDKIAQRAGVNKAMLYYHVGNKQALYSAVLMRNFDRIESTLAASAATSGTAQQRLDAVITAVNELVRTNPEHPRIVLREFAAGGINLPPEILQRMLAVLGIVRDLLAEGIAAGEFRATNPILTHLTIVGAVLFLNVITPLRERAARLESDLVLPKTDINIAQFLSDLLLHGIEVLPESGVSV